MRIREGLDEARTLRPMRLIGVMLLCGCTVAAVLYCYTLLRTPDIFLTGLVLGPMLMLVLIIIFVKGYVRIDLYPDRIIIRKAFRKMRSIESESISGMSIQTALMRDGLTKRLVTALKVDHHSGDVTLLEITPFTLHQRLEIVNHTISLTSGIPLSPDLQEMISGEDKEFNRKSNKIAILMMLPVAIVILIHFVVRIYYR